MAKPRGRPHGGGGDKVTPGCLCCINIYFILYREKIWPPCHSALLTSITAGGRSSQTTGVKIQKNKRMVIVIIVVHMTSRSSLVLLVKLFASFLRILEIFVMNRHPAGTSVW